jgi:hypothetical protein
LKRDTTANWLASTVKLQSGEPGWDITNKVLKIGDGNNLWGGLSAVSGGSGGPSLNPLTLSLNTGNPFPNDNTTNLISTWDINTMTMYNRSLVINDITDPGNPSEIYRNDTVNFPLSDNGEYTISLSPGSFFVYGHTYRIVAYKDATTELASLNVTYNNANLNFTLGTPYIISPKSIGLPYTYTDSPRVEGVRIRVYTTSLSDAIVDLQNQIIPRNYGGTTPTAFILGYSTGYSNNTYTIQIDYGGTRINTQTLSYTVPAISTYVFRPSNNQFIDITMNNSAPVTLRIANSIGAIFNGNTLVDGSTTQGIYLNDYPVFNNTYTITATFADSSYITAAPTLVFNKQATFTSLTFNSVTSGSDPSSCNVSLTFRNINSTTWSSGGPGHNSGDPRPSVFIRITKIDGTDSSDHVINSDSTGWSSSVVGGVTQYSINNSPITKSFTYGESYSAYVLNSDNTILQTITPIIITGNFSTSIVTRTPSIAGNAASVVGLGWSGINYSALTTNIYEYITGLTPSYTNPLGIGTYNTTVSSLNISLNTGNSFIIGTQYVVGIVHPNGNEYISLPSAAYTATNIVKKSIARTSVVVTVTWLENSITLKIFNSDASGTLGSQVNTAYTSTKPVEIPALTGTSDVTVPLNSPLTEFIYGNYYVVGVTFTSSSNASYYTNAFQYAFTSFTITDASPSFPASPANRLTFGFTPAGISGENRLSLTVYTITAANARSAIDTIEVPDGGWIASDYNVTVFENKILSFTGAALNPVTLTNPFVRNNFYFIELRCPTSSGISLAFSRYARVYNPSSIDVSLEPTSAFGTTSTNGTTNCTLNILGPTANATYYLRLASYATGVVTGRSTDTWSNTAKSNNAFVTPATSLRTANTYVTYKIPIEKANSATKTQYYLDAVLDVGDDTAPTDLVARYPTNSSTYFYYTYDSTIYVSNPLSVTFTNDNTTASFSIPWKGYPAKGWLYLTINSDGSGVNRRFRSIDLPNSPNTITTVQVNNATVYSNANPGAGVEPTTTLALGTLTYYPGLWLNTSDSTEKIVGTGIIYTPTLVVVSAGIVLQTKVSATFTWSGIDPGATLFGVTITPLGGAAVVSTNVSKPAGATSSSIEISYSTGWTSGTTYTISVAQVGGRAAQTDTFSFIATSLISKTFVFEDSTATTPYQLGRLNVGGNIASGYASVYVTLTLQEYTTLTSVATANAPSISFTLNITNNAGTSFSSKIWTQDNFTIGYYYNVLCSVFTAASRETQLVQSTFMTSPRQQYTPAGYDILVFIGQSNMCGRDDGNVTANSKETNATPPLYTNAEKTTPLVADNGINVHIVNNPNGSIITTTTAVQFDSVADNKTAGVTQAYEFTKLYASSVKSPSTRTVGVVFVPVGGTGFITGGGQWANNGTLYENAVNATNKYRTQRLVSGTNYSSNRVVAIVLHQGESDHGQETWNIVVNTAITSFINTDTAPMSDIKYTKFLCGNLDLLTSASAIDRSTLASGVSATEQAALRKAFVVPNQIDEFPTLRTGTYAAASYSSLGVVSIDADPDQPDAPQVVGNSGCYNGSSGGIHLSARAERLLGLRAFNAYARLIVGDTATTSTIYPSIAIDPVSALPPDLTTFNAQTNILSFNSTANSSAYSANPICYLISYVPASGAVVRIVATEYNSMQSTSTTTSNTRYCSIPYYTYSSGTRSSYGSGASFTLPITDVASGYPVNIYPAIYSFPSGEAYVVNGVKNSAMVDSIATSAVTPKPLNLDMTQFINSFTPTSNANVGSFTTLKFSLQIQAVYATGGVATPFTLPRPMALSQAYYLPPIIGTKMLNLQSAVSSSSNYGTVVPGSIIGSNWIVTPTLPGVGSGGSPILSTNRPTGAAASGGYLVFAGCPYQTTLSSGSWIGPTPSYRSLTSMSTATITSATTLTITLSSTPTSAIAVGAPVVLTFASGTLPGGSTGQNVLNGTYTTITGTGGTTVIVTLGTARTNGTFTPGSGSTVEANPAVAGITQSQSGTNYLVVGTATTTVEGYGTHAFGPGYTNSWSYTGTGGMTYSRVINGIDWVMFFSASKFATSTTSGLRSTITACPYNSLQFCGIAAESTGGVDCLLNPTGATLSSILNISNPMYYYMYNTGCGFIINLRNLNANNIYRIYYYISTRAGRVPHNESPDFGKVTIGGTETDLYLSNPLPIRIFTKTPTSNASTIGIIETSAVIGQDVHFGAGSSALDIVNTVGSQKYLSTNYLHSSSTAWDGSWKQMSFRFQFSRLTPIAGTISSDGSYNYNHAYLQFGPLPMVHRTGAPAANGTAEFVNTSINIAGISIVIDNSALI